jgi:hypothetical protein
MTLAVAAAMWKAGERRWELISVRLNTNLPETRSAKAGRSSLRLVRAGRATTSCDKCGSATCRKDGNLDLSFRIACRACAMKQ